MTPPAEAGDFASATEIASDVGTLIEIADHDAKPQCIVETMAAIADENEDGGETMVVRVEALSQKSALGPQQRISAGQAALLLASDIVELAILLAMTGGLQNPFSLLFVGPVLISATALPRAHDDAARGPRHRLRHHPRFHPRSLCRWWLDEPLELPAIYVIGVWISIVISIGYISVHAWQITEQGRQLADALAATELVLEREHHLSLLDGLAAAAAHELGTPLAIISVVSRELERAPASSPHAEDVRILREQAQRCRRNSRQARRPSDTGCTVRQPSAVGADRGCCQPASRAGHRIIIVTRAHDETPEPNTTRNPAILYGLGNLLENAADFAENTVNVAVDWNEKDVAVTIRDDGPGSLRKCWLVLANLTFGAAVPIARVALHPEPASVWVFYR